MKTKRFLTLALTIIMLSSVCLMAISCGGNEEKRADISKAAKGAYNTVVDEFGRVIDEYTMMTEKMTYIMPANASATSDGPLTSTTVGCKVTPDYATDKTTTWSVSWAEDAYRSSQNVSEYVELVPYAENSNLVTVNLIQYFGEDSVILTVKTNDGGFTDTCELTCFEAVKINLLLGYDSVEVQSSELIGVQYDEIGYVDYSYLEGDAVYKIDLNADSRFEEFYSCEVEVVNFFNSYGTVSGWTHCYYLGTSQSMVEHVSFENPPSPCVPSDNRCGFPCYDDGGYGLFYFICPIGFWGDNVQKMLDVHGSIFFSATSLEFYLDNTLGCMSGDKKVSELGYDIYKTTVPVMFKITISESVYNTSDSIYVTMKLPVSAVSMENTPDTYISE